MAALDVDGRNAEVRHALRMKRSSSDQEPEREKEESMATSMLSFFACVHKSAVGQECVISPHEHVEFGSEPDAYVRG
jgi:hypothetical protein